jgi:hypothetical protein
VRLIQDYDVVCISGDGDDGDGSDDVYEDRRAQPS